VYTSNKHYNYASATNPLLKEQRTLVGNSLDSKTRTSDLTNPFKKWKPQKKRLVSATAKVSKQIECP
jgi:hypothetical protein